jgi:hypothetical protein
MSKLNVMEFQDQARMGQGQMKKAWLVLPFHAFMVYNPAVEASQP